MVTTRAKNRGRTQQALLQATIERLETLGGTALERLAPIQAGLARLEENVRLLRQDLVGNGRPGRIAQLEAQVDQLRSEHLRERGVVAGISFALSLLAAFLAQWLRF
jgi:hypothetical protein